MKHLKIFVGLSLFLLNLSISAQAPDSGAVKPKPLDTLAGVEQKDENTITNKEMQQLESDANADTQENLNAPKATATKGESSALKKANLLFSEQAFSEAIPYYEKAKKADVNNKLILSNLAECYRLTSNIKGQIENYGALVNMGMAEPIQELYYGEALMENGEDDKARAVFEKYKVDSRGKELASSFERKKEFAKNADAYSLTPASFNSPQSDICAIKYYDATVFASSRTKISWIKTEHAWTNSGYLKMYATRKDKEGKELKPILFMHDLNSKFNDGPISFTKDYNMVFFTRNNVGKEDKSKEGLSKLAILVAYLDEHGFSEVEMLPFDNVQYNYTHPCITPDGYTLYFASDMPGGFGGMDIYRVKKDSLGVWGKVENMGDKVNSAGSDVFPYISPDSIFYFASNGHSGLGGLDLYEAKMKNGQVSRIYNMGVPVNSQHDDFALFVNEDLKTGFISSNRKAGDMDDDIYLLDILRKVKRGKDVTVTLLDKQSGKPLDSLTITVNGETMLTNSNGSCMLSVEDDTQYKILFSQAGYFPVKDSLNAESSSEFTFTKEIIVEKDPRISLKALITDGKNQALLDSVTIRITDVNTSLEYPPFLTGDSGVFTLQLPEKRIGDKLTYLIRLDRPGYLQRTLVFTKSLTEPGVVDMNKSLSFALGKVEVGMDLAKMVDLKPIYFDLGKSTIRPDAAMELDKIVQVMNEYPGMYIELGSHTDCRSSAKSNLKLSDQRAKASAAYIVKKGIKKDRIVGKGYGEAKLLNNCACEDKVNSACSEEEHSLNRRTEFIITKLK